MLPSHGKKLGLELKRKVPAFQDQLPPMHQNYKVSAELHTCNQIFKIDNPFSKTISEEDTPFLGPLAPLTPFAGPFIHRLPLFQDHHYKTPYIYIINGLKQ